jgi:hypothetical protein
MYTSGSDMEREPCHQPNHNENEKKKQKQEIGKYSHGGLIVSCASAVPTPLLRELY